MYSAPITYNDDWYRPCTLVHANIQYKTLYESQSQHPSIHVQVRKAFTADVAAGNTLIVADYGQLELRVLAHMADCQSMKTAFILGGDFHSRTAVGMYDHIQRAINAGDVLLEWEGEGAPPLPLVKDVYGSERRKAKVLNFSIAYGKTEHGLSKDWGVDIEEAKETVEKWYADRQEVKRWQEARRRDAVTKGYVETILGRRRMLPDAAKGNGRARGHALRAAINTPIQVRTVFFHPEWL